MLVASQTVTAELGWAARLGALVLMHSAVVMERHELTAARSRLSPGQDVNFKVKTSFT